VNYSPRSNTDSSPLPNDARFLTRNLCGKLSAAEREIIALKEQLKADKADVAGQE